MFTPEEVDVLFEALELWEKESSINAFTDALINAMTSPNTADIERHVTEALDVAKKMDLSRKRQSILLKAKVVHMQDENTVSNLFAGMELAEGD